MTDDFKPSPPALKGSVARGGEIDWKDRSTQLSMWVTDKEDSDGNPQQMLRGKVGGDPNKAVVLYIQEGWKLVQTGSAAGADGDW